jgi:uncharacterized protein (DUF1800 family)
MLAGCALLVSTGWASLRSPKKIKANANPSQYVAFSRSIPANEEIHHALERLTFGPRPRESERVEQIGLSKWLEMQLHPERIPENAALESRLSPLTSLRMSIRETYLNYPPPQLIRTVARGQGKLPEDPELRAVVLELAKRYEAKTAAQDKSVVSDPNDDADLSLRTKLEEVLPPQDITALQHGTVEQKKQVLAAIPPAKRLDFVWALRAQQRRQLFTLAPVELRRDLMLSVNPQNVIASDLSEGKLLRAVYSERQLQELLVDFWFNHFNVFQGKGADRYLLPTYEREAIRPHVFGKFNDLLLATAQSPAMLFYLDNWQSVAQTPSGQPAGVGKRRNERGLNENYGRELLELHTLGVNGGYTQKDVIEVARCFTGWTIQNPRKGGGFEYNDRVHDKGQKVVLGHVIPAGGGASDGLQVLKILSREPATAQHISFELAQRFVADDPPPTLVKRMAQTFKKSDGDLRQVVSTMIHSPEFWSQGAYRAKVKTPFEMIVSALRATDADVTSAFALVNELRTLGEPLYGKVEPTGYSNANAPWVSSDGLLDRMNFAIALAHNRVPGVKVDTAEWERLANRYPLALANSILGEEPSEATKAAIQKTIESRDLQIELAKNAKSGTPQTPSLIAGLALGSPDFQKR